MPATATDMAAEPPASAIDKIISTYELLEKVLSYLEIDDLIRVQGVCYRFKATIQDSKTLQQNLFLSPWTDPEPRHWLLACPHVYKGGEKIISIPDGDAEHLHQRNEFHEYVKEMDSVEDFYRQKHWIRHEYDQVMVPTVMNPLVFLTGELDSFEACAAFDPEGPPGRGPGGECIIVKKPRVPGRFGEMLMTQPPVLQMDVRIESLRTEEDDGHGWVKVRNNAGVTVGDIVKVLDAHDVAGVELNAIHFDDDDVLQMFQFEKDYYEAKVAANGRELEQRLADGEGGNCDSRYVDPGFMEWMTKKYGREYMSLGWKVCEEAMMAFEMEHLDQDSSWVVGFVSLAQS